MPEFTPPPEPPKDTDIIYQGPILRVGSIFHYVQETYPQNEEDAIRIMRSFVTKGYIKSKSKPDDTGYRLYENVDKIHNITSEDKAPDNDADALVKMALGMQQPTGPDKVELKTQHGTFEIASGPDAGIYENYVVCVANDHTVIQCEPSPMFSGRPLVNNARLTVVEGAVYGIGILEKALDEQDTANALHNQNIDATNSIIQALRHAAGRDQPDQQELPGPAHRLRGRGRGHRPSREDHRRGQYRRWCKGICNQNRPKLKRHRDETGRGR
jgi:hypothetical protein